MAKNQKEVPHTIRANKSIKFFIATFQSHDLHSAYPDKLFKAQKYRINSTHDQSHQFKMDNESNGQSENFSRFQETLHYQGLAS